MAITQQTVASVRVRVPIALNGASLVLSPAWDTFVATAQPLTVDNQIYISEVRNQGFTSLWEQAEFIALPTNGAALETAVATLQASLNTQNGSPTPALVVDVQYQPSTRILLS